MKVKFKKVEQPEGSLEAVVPYQASAGAANFDFTCTRIEKKAVNKYVLYFGLAVEFDPAYKMIIVPRSSITGTDLQMKNSPGQVDADYRGELQMRITVDPIDIKYIGEDDLFKLGEFKLVYPELPWKVGDRVAQGYLEAVIPVEFEEVQELSETARGTAGFGSTGTQNYNSAKLIN